MLCYWLLGIHRDTYREGRYEYYQLPSVDWVKVSLFEEDYGSKKRVRSEGRKREYEGFFWYLGFLQEVGRSCDECWFIHVCYG